jgi:NAD(P)H-dependent nitrite reductase small subunit
MLGFARVEFIEVARVNDLPVGRVKSVRIGDETIALYHTAKGFFASESRCPHRGGPLAEGDVIGDEIVCPWHLWGFNLETGLCPGNADICITMHEVKIEDDRLLVRLSPVRETSNLL